MKKEKYTVIIIIVALLALIGITIYNLLVTSGNVNGKRLNDAVEVDNVVISKIKDELSNSGNVSKVESNTNIKTIKFFITTDAKSEDAMKKASIITDNLNEKVINYYDIEVYFINQDNKDFPIIGYHSKNLKTFNWVLNEEATNEE